VGGQLCELGIGPGSGEVGLRLAVLHDRDRAWSGGCGSDCLGHQGIIVFILKFVTALEYGGGWCDEQGWGRVLAVLVGLQVEGIECGVEGLWGVLRWIM
jgi:hypothetical protein